MEKIAILDDRDDFCLVMDCLLNNYFEVFTFTNTNIFLENVRAEKYVALLIDLSINPSRDLNINNGCQVIAYLKNILKNPPLFILFTGWISRNSSVEGRKICPLADGFLAKDTDIEEIIKEINRLIDSKSV
ncbi:MAG TPA: hypothetical protein DDZ80_32535 [Cyanobacteria bacterium UBA8803]|nr:hypothetical protein [Cyanobacteria bacterium UBA9273]HBL62927.1 hypothetical protein [Cyanobacteria bacterium UBA8803]